PSHPGRTRVPRRHFRRIFTRSTQSMSRFAGYPVPITRTPHPVPPPSRGMESRATDAHRGLPGHFAAPPGSIGFKELFLLGALIVRAVYVKVRCRSLIFRRHVALSISLCFGYVL